MSSFYNQGPVPLASPAYIPRQFETDVFQQISSANWVLLLGPRQHGKTSGLIRLLKQLRAAGFVAALVDLQGLPPCGRFQDLLAAFAAQVGRSLARDAVPPRDEGSVSAWLDGVIPASNTPVVIIIDEAASIENTEFRNAFFGQIRQLSSSRAYAEPQTIEARVSFVFAGTFRPECLVHEYNSPFNVCRTIETDDISPGQAAELAKTISPELIGFVEAAHAQLNGQPFLLQTVLQETVRKADGSLELAFRESLKEMPALVSGHLEGIFSKIIGSPGLTGKVATMVRLGSTPWAPADSECHFLQVLGLAKRQDNHLVFRNKLYAEIACSSPHFIGAHAAAAAPAVNSVYSIAKVDFDIVQDCKLRAICYSGYDGAAKAHASEHYRLSLIGFGSAMEALLLDILLRQSSPALATAIAEADKTKEFKTSFNKAFESPVDPKTWRLVNMINVVRQIKVGKACTNPPEPSHVLREWRNLVHPAVVLKDFREEGSLAPESVAASAIFAILLRDSIP